MKPERLELKDAVYGNASVSLVVDDGRDWVGVRIQRDDRLEVYVVHLSREDARLMGERLISVAKDVLK